MIIREVKFEDYSEIKNLTDKYKINIYPKKDWENIWKNNPFLKKENRNWTMGWVLVNENKIVGHLGNIPTQYSYNLKNYYGSIMSCWVVELEHRLHSKKLIKEYHSQTNVDFYLVTTSNLATVKALSAYGWEKMPNKKYDLKLNIILNFKSVYESYIKKNFNKNNFFFKIVFAFLKIFLYQKINAWKKFKHNQTFEIYKKFDTQFDEFWEKIKLENKNTFLLNRSSEWINWHLNNKIQKNNSLIVVKKENNEIKGYAICINKYDSSLNLKKAVLIDLMLLKENEKSSLDLILSCIQESLKSKCDLFQMVGFNEHKRKFMNKLKPFEKKNKFSPYLYKSKNLDLDQLLQKKDSWYPSEIEGDTIY